MALDGSSSEGRNLLAVVGVVGPLPVRLARPQNLISREANRVS